MLATSRTLSQYPGRDLSVTRAGRWPINDGALTAVYSGQGTERPGQGGQRAERFTAETTAFSDARVVFASMPMPHRTLPSIAHSM